MVLVEPMTSIRFFQLVFHIIISAILIKLLQLAQLTHGQGTSSLRHLVDFANIKIIRSEYHVTMFLPNGYVELEPTILNVVQLTEGRERSDGKSENLENYHHYLHFRVVFLKCVQNAKLSGFI